MERIAPDAVGAFEPLYYLINLNRSPDRLAITGTHLRDRGISFSRIEAVDGQAIKLPLAGIDPDLYRRCHGRNLRLGEVGCYLSHLRAMSAFLASPHRYCVIFEDDVEFESDAASTIRDLVQKNLCDFDVVRLQMRRKGLALTAEKLDGKHELRLMLTRVTGSMAYIINRTAAQRYLERLLPLEVPYDHAFDRGLHLGLRIAFIAPALTRQSSAVSVSTIEAARSARSEKREDKVGPIGKLSVLRWRTETEIARFIAGVMEFLRRRLFERRLNAESRLRPLGLRSLGEIAAPPPDIKAHDNLKAPLAAKAPTGSEQLAVSATGLGPDSSG